MSYVICPVSIIPIRNSSSNKSEMISQLLFGELAEVLETKGRQWVKVRCAWDNFVGWVASNQLKPVTPSEFKRFQSEYAYSLELFHTILAQDFCVPIVMGAQLPGFDGMRFKLEEHYFTFSGQAVFPEHIDQGPEFVLKIARKYLHAPFLWGGRSPMGIDAPGLIQMVFKLCGVPMPREAEQQVFLGEAVDFVEQSRPGDIAFFENKAGRITHCGIILPNHEVLHAYGSVRIDSIDHFGIYNRKQARYTHRLRVVKRMLKSKVTMPDRVEKLVEKAEGQFELF